MTEEVKTAEKEKMTIVVFSGDLDKALAAFILATTGASMGMDVSMFFTFWGLNILKKNEGAPSGKGFMKKDAQFLNRGGYEELEAFQVPYVRPGDVDDETVHERKPLPSIDEFITDGEGHGSKAHPLLHDLRDDGAGGRRLPQRGGQHGRRRLFP